MLVSEHGKRLHPATSSNKPRAGKGKRRNDMQWSVARVHDLSWFVTAGEAQRTASEQRPHHPVTGTHTSGAGHNQGLVHEMA